MAGRGRPRKPIELKERQGNAGNRPLPAPINFGRIDPDEPAPEWLPLEAAEHWAEVVPPLAHAGILNRVDRNVLVGLCLQWQTVVDARDAIEKDGPFAEGSMGQTVEHPAIAVERNAMQAYLRIASEVGITPAARARIAAHVAGVPPSDEDELADVIDMTPEIRSA